MTLYGGSNVARSASVSGAATSLTQWNNLQQESADQINIEELLTSIRSTLRARGIT